MKWKIKVKPKKVKTTAFLFSPRYCGDCGNAYWWERVKRDSHDRPECECGGYLWLFKDMAEEDLRRKYNKE